MFAFKSHNLPKYKSYAGKSFDISMSSNGTDPQHLVVKVFNTKKPKAQIEVHIGWFSDSRGYGGTSAKTIITFDPETVLLCRAALKDDAAVAPLIDKVLESDAAINPLTAAILKSGQVKRLLARWWVLAQQERPDQFINEERKERAFADKKFAIGEQVLYRPLFRSSVPVPVTITSERFEWVPHLYENGWRFGFTHSDYVGGDARQQDFAKVEQPAVAS
jgi:hypothetical protein